MDVVSDGVSPHACYSWMTPTAIIYGDDKHLHTSNIKEFCNAFITSSVLNKILSWKCESEENKQK